MCKFHWKLEIQDIDLVRELDEKINLSKSLIKVANYELIGRETAGKGKF